MTDIRREVPASVTRDQISTPVGKRQKIIEALDDGKLAGVNISAEQLIESNPNNPESRDFFRALLKSTAFLDIDKGSKFEELLKVLEDHKKDAEDRWQHDEKRTRVISELDAFTEHVLDVFEKAIQD